jgi:hypothetical protein
MSVFAPGAPQIWLRQTRSGRTQFHAGAAGCGFKLCRLSVLLRNDVTLLQCSVPSGVFSASDSSDATPDQDTGLARHDDWCVGPNQMLVECQGYLE